MPSCSDNVCGIGGWGGPLPGDPDNNSILSATSAFGGIDVSWSYPETNPQAVAHTLLYRGLTANFDSAIQLQVVAGNFFHDRLDTPIRYYYWIRIVSVNGTVGELIGPASAVAKPTIAGMIELLTGQIDAGLLSQTLKLKLDEISALNANLLNEITSRENGEVTLAEALEQVDAGVAQALTFIHEEINSRTTADTAIAEQLNILAATLDDQYAAVIQTMQVNINALTGKTNAIWSAQVNVNGLIGGFGLVGDGSTVEAGFDVDTFWVGRTNANKRKPFIISDGVTYIDDAAIRSLTFSKLRDEAGTFVVEGGKLKASYISATYLSSLSASMGQVTINGMNGDWGYMRSPGKWLDGNWGWIFAQAPSGSMFFDITLNGFRLWGHHDAGVAASWGLEAPGISMGPGGLTVGQLNVIGTAQVQGNAITVPWAFQESNMVVISGSGGSVSTGGNVQCFGGRMLIFGSCEADLTATSGTGDNQNSYKIAAKLAILRNGAEVWRSSTSAICFVDDPGPGVFNYAVRVSIPDNTNGNGPVTLRNLVVLESRR